jgi:hypothetical protein
VTSTLQHLETARDGQTLTGTQTCQAFAGSLVAPCPNTATDTTVVRGQRRSVCPAHAPFRFPHQRG